MPEMADRDFTELHAFRAIAASPDEVRRKIAELEKDNHKQRGEIDGLKEKVKAVPADGSVVLSKEDGEAHAAFVALNLKPADIAALVTERDTLKVDKSKRERRDALVAGREAEGWNEQAADVLLNTVGFDALEITVEDVDVERVVAGVKKTEKAKAPFVTVDGKKVRASEWVKEHLPHLPPVLSAQSTNGTSTTQGITVTEMRGGGGDYKPAAEGGIAAMVEANRKASEAPNPLRPAKVA